MMYLLSKSLPLRGKVARSAGMRGDLPPLPVQFSAEELLRSLCPHQSPAATASPEGEAFLLFQPRQHPRLGLNDSAQSRFNIDLRLPAVDLAGVGVVALA